jgi:hypothetical protein
VKKIEKVFIYIAIALLAATTSATGFYTYKLWEINEEQSPENWSDVPPRNIGGLYDFVAESTVTINCANGFGSGFSFYLDLDYFENQLSWNFDLPRADYELVVTNYHVIENCHKNNKETIKVVRPSEEVLKAEIKKVDPSNDLAVLLIRETFPGLAPYVFDLYPAHWVMAMGSAFRMTGTVSLGHISNIDGYKIYTTASLNQGNSGGPLVDNEGNVVGINTGYRALAQDVNWAIDINALCVQIITCDTANGLIHPFEKE